MKKGRVNGNRAEQAETMLRALMRETGPEGRLPTVSELCRILQVSLGTLDRVLERLERQGLISRQRGRGLFVTDAINRKTVALVFGRGYSEGYTPFWLQLESKCRERVTATGDRFRFFVDRWPSSSEIPSHDELDAALRGRELDGLIVSALDVPEQLAWLQNQGIPVVALTDFGEAPYRVFPNYDSLIQQAVEALVSHGARHVLTLAPFPETRIPLETQLRERGVPFTTANFNLAPYSADPTRQSMTFEEHGYRTMRDLLSRRLKADTVVSLDDTLTRGALMAIAQAGLVVGKDLTVITHANRNTPTLAPYAHDLILIEFDPNELVVAAVDMLERLMLGRIPPCATILLDPVLKIKGAMPLSR
jgi:DNA-binding LacI/PurR family transcriptional regulator